MNPFRRMSAIRKSEGGIALTEFALSLPFLCLLGLGGLELANVTLAYLRVYDIAVKVADNAARVRTSIDETDINEIFVGAKMMGASLDFASNGRIILSSIEPVMSTSGTPRVVNQYLRWQRCTGADAANSTHGNEGDGRTTSGDQASGYGLPGGAKIRATERNALMLVEVVYQYQPIVSNEWLGSIEIRAIQTMPVRQRMDQVLRNGKNLPNAQRMLCTNAHTA